MKQVKKNVNNEKKDKRIMRESHVEKKKTCQKRVKTFVKRNTLYEVSKNCT